MACARLIGGGPTMRNINGSVVVAAGESCTLSFVNIMGDARVGRDATLIVSAYTEPSEIGGDVEARNCKPPSRQCYGWRKPEYRRLQRRGTAFRGRRRPRQF
jgi:hypothetical protein